MDLKLQIGDVGIDYAEVAKKEHLTELEVEVGSTLEHSHVVVDRLQFFAREYVGTSSHPCSTDYATLWAPESLSHI